MSLKSVPDYEQIAIKGSGTFGYVIEAYDRVHDIRVAIKRTQTLGTKLSREYEILSQVKDGEYIVKLLDVFYTINDDKKIIQNLVFEFVPFSLDKYIEGVKDKKEHIKLKTIKNIAKQIILGLDYCHKKNIMHRDLKPENILLTQDEKVKICDFGSAKILNEEGNTYSCPYMVTRHYRAPELILGKNNYDTKVDIFSAGCILGELFTLTTLFPGNSDGLQLFEYINILGIPDEKYFKNFNLPQNFTEYIESIKNIKTYSLEEILNPDSFYDSKDIKEAIDLILRMLDWDYTKRYSAEQCLKHPFLLDKN